MAACASHPALVARAPLNARDSEQYLLLTSNGCCWVADAGVATRFDSMKMAMREALRLPGGLRAFGLPAPTVH